MALVLYNGGAPGTTGGTAANVSSTRGKSYPKDSKEYAMEELKRVREKIERLEQGERKIPYLGLANQGATCYMNSLI
jgi:ubiquitin C-terminal hydrolase